MRVWGHQTVFVILYGLALTGIVTPLIYNIKYVYIYITWCQQNRQVLSTCHSIHSLPPVEVENRLLGASECIPIGTVPRPLRSTRRDNKQMPWLHATSTMSARWTETA